MLTHRDRFDTPTWKPCRKGRRPTVFPTREAAEEAVAEHLATAEHFGIVTGNLSFAQVVDVEEFEASLRKDPTDRVAQRVQQVELAVAKRKAEESAAEAAALEAELSASKPVSRGDWHAPDEQQVQQRVRADGSKVFRARVAGRISPSFDTIEQAVAWRDQGAA